jgi:hypothetical protein
MIGDEIGYIDMAERDQVETTIASDDERGVVDVVLSDMSEPWPQTEGFWKNYLTEAYFRMSNVSGIRVKDHGDSMVHIPFPYYCLFFFFRLSFVFRIWGILLMVGFMRCGDIICNRRIEKSRNIINEILHWSGRQSS